MTITAQEIRDLDVDGGVEEIVLALLVEIDALKARPSETAVPDEYTMTYPGGIVVTYRKVL